MCVGKSKSTYFDLLGRSTAQIALICAKDRADACESVRIGSPTIITCMTTRADQARRPDEMFDLQATRAVFPTRDVAHGHRNEVTYRSNHISCMPSSLWIGNIDDDTFRTFTSALFGPARKSRGNGESRRFFCVLALVGSSAWRSRAPRVSNYLPSQCQLQSESIPKLRCRSEASREAWVKSCCRETPRQAGHSSSLCCASAPVLHAHC